VTIDTLSQCWKEDFRKDQDCGAINIPSIMLQGMFKIFTFSACDQHE
jgi:hypothetical protein